MYIHISLDTYVRLSTCIHMHVYAGPEVDAAVFLYSFLPWTLRQSLSWTPEHTRTVSTLWGFLVSAFWVLELQPGCHTHPDQNFDFLACTRQVLFYPLSHPPVLQCKILSPWIRNSSVGLSFSKASGGLWGTLGLENYPSISDEALVWDARGLSPELVTR